MLELVRLTYKHSFAVMTVTKWARNNGTHHRHKHQNAMPAVLKKQQQFSFAMVHAGLIPHNFMDSSEPDCPVVYMHGLALAPLEDGSKSGWVPVQSMHASAAG